MTWLPVLKVALTVFLVVGVGVVAIAFIRKSRRNGFPAPESSSQFWQIKGAMPPTPKPDWSEWHGDGEGGGGRSGPT